MIILKYEVLQISVGNKRNEHSISRWFVKLEMKAIDLFEKGRWNGNHGSMLHQ